MAEKEKSLNILKLFSFALFLGALIIFSLPSSSCAAEAGGEAGEESEAVTNAGCAVDTWVSMVNQAALQTRREDMMNKRFIVKADSVLQYSCFNEEVAHMAVEVPLIFSGNDYWVGKEVELYEGTETDITVDEKIYEDHSLANALAKSVQPALVDYINQQFGHWVLSGFHLPASAEANQNNEPYEPPLCYNMANIWKYAKCRNFNGTKVFYRFEDLIKYDPRIFPPNMACELEEG